MARYEITTKYFDGLLRGYDVDDQRTRTLDAPSYLLDVDAVMKNAMSSNA